MCIEIINATDNISTNVTSTVSINSDNKIVRHIEWIVVFAHGFVGHHTNIYDCYYLLSLFKT